jgi:hypothetical protein
MREIGFLYGEGDYPSAMMTGCQRGVWKTNPMNERAMRIFEFGEKEQGSEEIEKKRVKELLERGDCLDKRATGVGRGVADPFSISDKHVFLPTQTTNLFIQTKQKGYLTLVSSLCIQRHRWRYQI